MANAIQPQTGPPQNGKCNEFCGEEEEFADMTVPMSTSERK